MKRREATQATCVGEVGVSLPRRISGKVILVISGRSRKMYQSLEPEPEGAIFPKRSGPQEDNSSPHDAGTSMANWLETNIQGGKRLELGNLSLEPCGYQSRLAKPGQQPEASLAWWWGDPPCEA